jgi:uridine kinase
METLIIHISGASGSGKTTLGNKLKEHFKSKIIVKDLDILRFKRFKKYRKLVEILINK